MFRFLRGGDAPRFVTPLIEPSGAELERAQAAAKQVAALDDILSVAAAEPVRSWPLIDRTLDRRNRVRAPRPLDGPVIPGRPS